MLKIKRQLDYRRGVKGMNCGTCVHFVPDFQVHSCEGRPLKIDQRCSVIGLQNGRMYRVAATAVCSRYDDRK
jgi:hypothetical protein